MLATPSGQGCAGTMHGRQRARDNWPRVPKTAGPSNFLGTSILSNVGCEWDSFHVRFKTLLNKLPASIWLWADNILSFFSVKGQSNRTRAIWTILLHQTCSLSTKNKFRGRNQIRLDPVQLFCNSFCVQHKMVGDDYSFILQCLVYHNKGTVHHWGILTRP